MVRDLATKVGAEISKTLVSNNLGDLLEEIARFWEKHSLGDLQVLKSDSITIVVRGCYKCQFLGDEAAASICSFGQAIIQSIIDSKLGRPTQSFGTPTPNMPGVACSFELEENHPSPMVSQSPVTPD